jgi:hypothetical protein
MRRHSLWGGIPGTDTRGQPLRSMPGPRVFGCTGWWVIATLIGSRCSPTHLDSVSCFTTRECGGGPRLGDLVHFLCPRASVLFRVLLQRIRKPSQERKWRYQLRMQQAYALCMIQRKICTFLTFPDQRFSLAYQ